MRIILKSVGFTGAKNSRTLVVDTSLPPSSKLFWHLAALIHVNIQLRQLMRWWCSDTTTDWNEVVSFGFSSLVRVSLVRSFFPSCLLIFPFVTFSCTSFVCLSSPPYCRVASPQSFNFSPPDHPLLSASLTSLWPSLSASLPFLFLTSSPPSSSSPTCSCITYISLQIFCVKCPLSPTHTHTHTHIHTQYRRTCALTDQCTWKSNGHGIPMTWQTSQRTQHNTHKLTHPLRRALRNWLKRQVECTLYGSMLLSTHLQTHSHPDVGRWTNSQNFSQKIKEGFSSFLSPTEAILS